jgi:hypothetical protein
MEDAGIHKFALQRVGWLGRVLEGGVDGEIGVGRFGFSKPQPVL